MPSLLSFVSFFPELWERTATSLLDRLKKDLWYYITYTIEQFQFDNVLRIPLGLEKDLKGGGLYSYQIDWMFEMRIMQVYYSLSTALLLKVPFSSSR